MEAQVVSAGAGAGHIPQNDFLSQYACAIDSHNGHRSETRAGKENSQIISGTRVFRRVSQQQRGRVHDRIGVKRADHVDMARSKIVDGSARVGAIALRRAQTAAQVGRRIHQEGPRYCHRVEPRRVIGPGQYIRRIQTQVPHVLADQGHRASGDRRGETRAAGLDVTAGIGQPNRRIRNSGRCRGPQDVDTRRGHVRFDHPEAGVGMVVRTA